MDRDFKSVHDAHCCPNHGCKYGDKDCPVMLGVEQGFQEGCEDCEIEKTATSGYWFEEAKRYAKNADYWRERAERAEEANKRPANNGEDK